MTTVGKFALGMMGRLRPRPAVGDANSMIGLPAVDAHGGMPLMRRSARAGRRASSRPIRCHCPCCPACCGPPGA